LVKNRRKFLVQSSAAKKKIFYIFKKNVINAPYCTNIIYEL